MSTYDALSLLTTIVMGVLSTSIYSLISRYLYKRREKHAETTEDRVKRLTKSLREATVLIGNIEAEIQARSSLVSQLQNDIDEYNRLVELKKPEVEAIAQLLRGELKKESRSSFWKSILVNFLFFILGAGASWIINIITK